MAAPALTRITPFGGVGLRVSEAFALRLSWVTVQESLLDRACGACRVGDVGAGRQRLPADADCGSRSPWRNDLSGTVHGPVVQARSILGDVVFNVASPARVLVPGQLPPAPSNFADRVSELAFLDGLLAGPSRPGQ